MTEQVFMQRAVALALEKMRTNSGGPFGAVIVRNNTIISEGWNEVTSSNDPTAHAEIVAIRRACALLGAFNLPDCDIYTSCEPCPMCLGAIYWARLRRAFPPSLDCQILAFSPRGGHAMTDITAPVTPPVNFLDNPHAPEVFADGTAGFFNFAGNIRVTLEGLRVNHVSTPGPVNRVVIARVIMPIDAAEALARGLLDFITQQRTQQNPPAQTAPATRH
ncbi:MAG TPA: nucleoside deaminase [Pseudolabrys sp.]|jgi:pyrimidine deaminase RibD-like protein|nr:nucleoside deaminase [Pseudolabrys sp.]